MIEITVSNCSTVILRPFGDLDVNSSFQYRHVIDEVLHEGIDIVIDLRHVLYMDAVGLSAILGTVRRVAALGGKAEIRNAPSLLNWIIRPFHSKCFAAGDDHVKRPVRQSYPPARQDLNDDELPAVRHLYNPVGVQEDRE